MIGQHHIWHQLVEQRDSSVCTPTPFVCTCFRPKTKTKLSDKCDWHAMEHTDIWLQIHQYIYILQCEKRSHQPCARFRNWWRFRIVSEPPVECVIRFINRHTVGHYAIDSIHWKRQTQQRARARRRERKWKKACHTVERAMQFSAGARTCQIEWLSLAAADYKIRYGVLGVTAIWMLRGPSVIRSFNLFGLKYIRFSRCDCDVRQFFRQSYAWIRRSKRLYSFFNHVEQSNRVKNEYQRQAPHKRLISNLNHEILRHTMWISMENQLIIPKIPHKRKAVDSWLVHVDWYSMRRSCAIYFLRRWMW